MNDSQVADLLTFLRKIAVSLERIADNFETKNQREARDVETPSSDATVR
jgi:hypothetical protein